MRRFLLISVLFLAGSLSAGVMAQDHPAAAPTRPDGRTVLLFPGRGSDTLSVAPVPVADNASAPVPVADAADAEPSAAAMVPVAGNVAVPVPVADAADTRPIASAPSGHPVIAFSTNLLFDAATAVNLSAEFILSDHLSLKAQGIAPWWTWNKGRNAFQVLNGSLGLRYWFSGDPFSGISLGFAGGGGVYDIQPSDKGWRGFDAFASLTFSYAIRLSRHWAFDFGLGLGAVFTKYDRYEEIDPGLRAVVERDCTALFLGPTDAAVSLVLMF